MVGHAATIAAGEFIQASGTWVNDRTHGLQFKAAFLKTSPPTTLEGIERYLGSGMIRGIGPVYAKNGVGTSRAVRIYKTYGTDALQVISENPYRLARDIRGTSSLA